MFIFSHPFFWGFILFIRRLLQSHLFCRVFLWGFKHPLAQYFCEITPKRSASPSFLYQSSPNAYSLTCSINPRDSALPVLLLCPPQPSKATWRTVPGEMWMHFGYLPVTERIKRILPLGSPERIITFYSGCQYFFLLLLKICVNFPPCFFYLIL
jgi:hypothetical protein